MPHTAFPEAIGGLPAAKVCVGPCLEGCHSNCGPYTVTGSQVPPRPLKWVLYFCFDMPPTCSDAHYSWTTTTVENLLSTGISQTMFHRKQVSWDPVVVPRVPWQGPVSLGKAASVHPSWSSRIYVTGTCLFNPACLRQIMEFFFFFFLASKLARISKETPFQAEVTLGQLSSSIPFTLPEMRMNGYLWFVSSEPLEFRSVLDLWWSFKVTPSANQVDVNLAETHIMWTKCF